MYRTSEKTSLSRKMAELEDRWRKSQEDRYILELKFKELLKGLANKNEGNKLLKIREKYNRFLENEDARNERNDRIIRTLDKIESQANMLSAKTERLKLLKLHYEAYMKRMYPTWEKEVNSGEIMVNKDRVYPVSRKHGQKDVYTTLRDEATHKNGNSVAPYSPRQSEKLRVSSTDFQRELINDPQAESLSNYHIDDVNPRHTIAENIAVQRLNHEFSRVGMNSEDKTNSSHGHSFEQEENTSKDLLNVSLSDDNIINDVTIPVNTEKIRKGKKDEENHRPTESGVDNMPLQKNNMNRDINLQYGKGDDSNMFLNNQNRENIGNDFISHVSEKISDSPSDLEGQVVRGSTSELQPSVVVTQPTPDIGKSSSEDDVSGRGIMVEDKKSKRQDYISSHETSGLTSEAEVSEAEAIACESGEDYRDNAKELADAEQSPRPTTSFGNNQKNLEESFQFSSSDADYDELENQMAAVVEGKRNDKSKSKHFSQAGYKGKLNNNHIDNESVEHTLDNVGGKPTISSDTTEEEMGQQNHVSNKGHDQGMEGGNAGVSSDNVESAPADACLESEDKGNFWGHRQHSDTLSEEEEVYPPGENVEGEESYDPGHDEEISKQGGSLGYVRPDEEEENTSVSTKQEYDENFDQQDGIEVDTSRGEGVEHEREDQYYEEPENVVENVSSNYSKEDIYHNYPEVKSVEGSEVDHENDGENKNYAETGGGDSDYNNDRDIDFQVEQLVEVNRHFEKNNEGPENNYDVDEQEEEGEVGEGEVYTQDSGDQDDQSLMEPEHELQEKTWLKEEKDEVASMAQEGYGQYEERQEKIEVVANDEYITEQDEVEPLYGNEMIEGSDNLEETNEIDGRVLGSYETMENQGAEETDQNYVKEDLVDPYEKYDEGGEAEEREFESGIKRETEEGYDMVVNEEKEVMGNQYHVQEGMESEIGEYKHVESDEIAVEPHCILDESRIQERDFLETDQERSQYDADIHGESEIVEMSYAHEKEEEGKEISEENYAHDIKQEIEEPDKLQEQKTVEKTDASENVDAHPKTEIVVESDVVKQEDHSRQYPEQKELHNANKERAVGGKIEKTATGEVRAISQKTTKKEDGQVGKSVKGTQKEKESARKDTEHAAERAPVEKAERPTKESSQVPSRPLSRQSTRKDGSSPDTYKGEKLKTAIRKFQAKKDTRQTTRRSVDPKK